MAGLSAWVSGSGSDMSFLPLSSLLIVAAVCAGSVCHAQPLLPEYQAKIALIEKLTRFVEWPSQGAGTTFHLVVVGRTPFGDGLEDYFASHLVKGRSVTLTYLAASDPIGPCDLLFVSPSEYGRVEGILAKVKGQPILTVADLPGAAQRGVMVNILREGSRMVFEVNLHSVRASGLRMHPGFLQLARMVSRD